MQFFGIWYAYCRGMAKYVKHNVRGSRREELTSTWHCLEVELGEFWIEVYNFNVLLALVELSDVWHAFIKYCMIWIFPRYLLECSFMYIGTFWLALPTTIKHGFRYRLHKCIRNHGNKANLDHKCKYV